MTAELVLLLSVYALFIIALFLHPKDGAVHTFKDNLPRLSARVEKHIVTGAGFGPLEWDKPPQ